MKKFPILLLLTACWSLAAAQERPQVPAAQKRNLRTEIIAADSTGELLAQLRNMPNIEIGKGINDGKHLSAEAGQAILHARGHFLIVVSVGEPVVDHLP